MHVGEVRREQMLAFLSILHTSTYAFSATVRRKSGPTGSAMREFRHFRKGLLPWQLRERLPRRNRQVAWMVESQVRSKDHAGSTERFVWRVSGGWL
jgi:hypothetical protein